MRPLIQLARDLMHQPDRERELLEHFIKTHEFPMVSDEHATFFFWDGEAADQVYLRHWVYGLESRQPFQRLPHSNGFWLTINLPYSARLEYKFEIQRGENSYWVRDPHNRAKAFDPFGANSVCTMPGYEIPHWTYYPESHW